MWVIIKSYFLVWNMRDFCIFIQGFMVGALIVLAMAGSDQSVGRAASATENGFQWR